VPVDPAVESSLPGPPGTPVQAGPAAQPLAGQVVPAAVGGASRQRGILAAFLGAAAVFLVVALIAGSNAWHDATRAPTAAERSAAAAQALADRWRTVPAGQIFPPALPYTTVLLDNERASRAGMAPGYQCAAALTGAAIGMARRQHCLAAVRASYIDQPQGVVYTAGLLAFPAPRQARLFARGLASRPLPAGLQALALPGTAAARFSDAARQSEVRQQNGPFVVLVVAGYADGRPAAADGETRPSVFSAAGQLATAILTPLQRPVTVNCASAAWSC